MSPSAKLDYCQSYSKDTGHAREVPATQAGFGFYFPARPAFQPQKHWRFKMLQ
jgi:hypothetical protein